MTRGRKPSTGRFETRCELVEHVLFLYHQTSCNMDRIGRNVGIACGSVSKIIDDYSQLKNLNLKCKENHD